MVRDFLADYMNCVLIGVIKMLKRLWLSVIVNKKFNSPFRLSRYHIISMNLVNNNLIFYLPKYFIKRQGILNYREMESN